MKWKYRYCLSASLGPVALGNGSISFDGMFNRYEYTYGGLYRRGRWHNLLSCEGLEQSGGRCSNIAMLNKPSSSDDGVALPRPLPPLRITIP